MIFLTDEEEEIFKILNICFKSQRSIIKTTIKKLKKFNPKVMDETFLTKDYSEILKELEEDSEEDSYKYVSSKLHSLFYLYAALQSKKEASEELFNTYYSELLNKVEAETNIVITPEVELEATEILINVLKNMNDDHIKEKRKLLKEIKETEEELEELKELKKLEEKYIKK